MKLIETKTLGTAQASIEFTSIPQDGTDLVVVWATRHTVSGTTKTRILFNGSTANFSYRVLQGDGSGAATGANTINLGGITNGSSTTANTFSNNQMYIPNYTGNTNKSFSVDAVSENNAVSSFQDFWAGLWSNTAAITSITIAGESGDTLVAGSIVSLYKITKGSDGIVTTSP
jgi:hypothetical protein